MRVWIPVGGFLLLTAIFIVQAGRRTASPASGPGPRTTSSAMDDPYLPRDAWVREAREFALPEPPPADATVEEVGEYEKSLARIIQEKDSRAGTMLDAARLAKREARCRVAEKHRAEHERRKAEAKAEHERRRAERRRENPHPERDPDRPPPIRYLPPIDMGDPARGVPR
ncbi:MAG: hypothetical protein HY716_18070 [Planctomycetes bacterium]|nr:hypothetical protein [Planctomycetota bacterium]